jgi:hypothetical protein
MFILCQSLPTNIFWPKPISINSHKDWTLFYFSAQNGLRINRLIKKLNFNKNIV